MITFILFFPVWHMINFITIMSLLYLFDYQGRKRKKLETVTKESVLLIKNESINLIQSDIKAETTLAYEEKK